MANESERLDALERLIDERDRLYTERHAASKAAIEAALIAVKDQTAASFAASEKAIVKAEEAQKSYNQSHNDLARKMDEQYKLMMPRTESMALHKGHDVKFDEVKKDIILLREFRSAGEGKSAGIGGTTAVVIGAISILIALSSLIIAFLKL